MMNQSVGGIFDQMRNRRMNEEQEEVKETEVNEENTNEVPAQDSSDGFEDPIEETISEEDLDEAVKKVVRDGKVVTKKTTTKKKRLTSAQKAALAKARKKAHTGAAEKARAKSNKKRASMGLNDEECIECPECGFEGVTEDFDEEDGVLYCPECGAEISQASEACKKNEGCKSKKNEEIDVAELAVRLDECNGSDYMKKALNEGKYDLVQKYLDIKEGE